MSKVVTAHTNTSHIHKQKKTDPESRKTGQEGEIDKISRPAAFIYETNLRGFMVQNIPGKGKIFFPSFTAWQI